MAAAPPVVAARPVGYDDLPNARKRCFGAIYLGISHSPPKGVKRNEYGLEPLEAYFNVETKKKKFNESYSSDSDETDWEEELRMEKERRKKSKITIVRQARLLNSFVAPEFPVKYCDKVREYNKTSSSNGTKFELLKSNSESSASLVLPESGDTSTINSTAAGDITEYSKISSNEEFELSKSGSGSLGTLVLPKSGDASIANSVADISASPQAVPPMTVSPGGRQYSYVVVNKRAGVTPGVRRSKRTHMPTVMDHTVVNYGQWNPEGIVHEYNITSSSNGAQFELLKSNSESSTSLVLPESGDTSTINSIAAGGITEYSKITSNGELELSKSGSESLATLVPPESGDVSINDSVADISASPQAVPPMTSITSSPGGRQYSYVAVNKRAGVTPGVRQSKRTRVPTVTDHTVVGYGQWNPEGIVREYNNTSCNGTKFELLKSNSESSASLVLPESRDTSTINSIAAGSITEYSKITSNGEFELSKSGSENLATLVPPESGDTSIVNSVADISASPQGVPPMTPIVSPGGRRYRCVAVSKRAEVTPGVRRSKRTHVPTLMDRTVVNNGQWNPDGIVREYNNTSCNGTKFELLKSNSESSPSLVLPESGGTSTINSIAAGGTTEYSKITSNGELELSKSGSESLATLVPLESGDAGIVNSVAGISASPQAVLPMTPMTVSPGGRRYKCVTVNKRAGVTPGVRRSKRTRVPTVTDRTVVDYGQWSPEGQTVRRLLVPMNDEERPKRRRRRNLISNEDFPEVQYKDADGNIITTERVVFTYDSADVKPVNNNNCSIHSYWKNQNSSVGVLTIAPGGHKKKCRPRGPLCLSRIAGTVSVEVDELIYDIFSGHTVVNIPQGVGYSIKNKSKTKEAKLYYFAIEQ